MYAQIGDIVLSNRYGFSGFTDTRGVQYAQHALIDSKPRLQSTGDDLIALKFSIRLHRQFIIPETEIEKFTQYLNEKTIVPITLGTGEYLGEFVITNITKEVVQTLDDGTIFECTLDISILEWVGNISATIQGKAISSNNPPRFQSIDVPMSPAGKVVTDVHDTTAMANAMDKDIQDANNNPAKRGQKMKAALLKTQQLDQNLKNVKNIVANSFRLVNEAKNLEKKAERSQKDLAKLKSALEIRDMESAMQANRDFQTNLGNVSGATSPFTKSYSLRRSV
jgi:phage protein U